MAINKVMLAALKALSYPDFDETKHYMLHRQIIQAAAPKNVHKRYTIWDHKITQDGHDIPVRIFIPKYISAEPEQESLVPPSVLLFFHGGGWVTGNIDSYSRICNHMANTTNRIVISVDYRLAPEHPFPAAIQDCYAVARELYLNTHLFGITPKDITMIGDSAGGNLAAAVSLMARDRGEFLPKSQILLYPATYNDHSPNSPFPSIVTNGTDYLLTSKRIMEYMQLYKGNDENLSNPYLAPLLAESLANQPDTLLITAEYDPLRDEGEAYGKKLHKAGNHVMQYRMPDALHGFIALPPRFVDVRKTYKLIKRFLNEVNPIEAT